MVNSNVSVFTWRRRVNLFCSAGLFSKKNRGKTKKKESFINSSCMVLAISSSSVRHIATKNWCPFDFQIVVPTVYPTTITTFISKCIFAYNEKQSARDCVGVANFAFPTSGCLQVVLRNFTPVDTPKPAGHSAPVSGARRQRCHSSTGGVATSTGYFYCSCLPT